MNQTVRGKYRNGQIELLEQPRGIAQADVIVTFVEEIPDAHHSSVRLRFGMFAKPGVRMSTLEDFADLKKDWERGEP